MLLFDRVPLLALGDNTSAATINLSGMSIVLILACTELLENRGNWDEMTDSEWDELEALISALVNEVT